MRCVGGTALRNGIIFTSGYKKAIGTIKSNGEFKIQVKDQVVATNPLLDNVEYYIYKMPFIRGVYDLIRNKDILIAIVLIQISNLLIKYINKVNLSNNKNLSDNIPLIIIEILFCIVSSVYLVKIFKDILKDITKLKAIFSFHGAEHKAINTFIDNRELNIDEVKKSSRISHRCGSNLVMFWIFIMIILITYFKSNSYIINIVSYAFAYELFNIKNGEKMFFISLFYKLASILQEKVITIEPNEKQIELAILTLKELEKAENEYEVENFEQESV